MVKLEYGLMDERKNILKNREMELKKDEADLNDERKKFFQMRANFESLEGIVEKREQLEIIQHQLKNKSNDRKKIRSEIMADIEVREKVLVFFGRTFLDL